MFSKYKLSTEFADKLKHYKSYQKRKMVLFKI